MEEINNNEEFQYIKERVKQRPINRKKLMRRMIITASMAVIFGVLACFTFLFLEPVFTNLLHPEQKTELVEIPDDTDEILPEDMKLEDEPKTTIKFIEKDVPIDSMEIYNDQYAQIYNIAQNTLKSTVTVTSLKQDTDWFDNEYVSKGTSSALCVANNNKEFFFLAYTDKIIDSENITVTFYDGSVANGTIKQSDANTGLSIVTVEKENVSLGIRNNLSVATLANSKVSTLLATPVIAIGRPYGSSESVGFGMLVAKGNYIYLDDQNYELLTTDIYGSEAATGIIINLKGEVLGIIAQNYSPTDSPNLLTAIGISDLKKTIERMSNGREKAYLGVIGMDVSPELAEARGIPEGAFVTSIVMDSPAMNGGIQSGDIIVRIGNKTVQSYSDVAEALNISAPDTTVNVVLKRQNGEEYKEMNIEITLKSKNK